MAKNKVYSQVNQYANREEEIRKAKGNPNKNNHSKKKNSNYGGYSAGSYMAQKIYTKRGVNFCLKCKVTGIEGNTVVYEDPEGNTQRVSGDKILVSVGRRANIGGFGLENLGVEMQRRLRLKRRIM